MSETVIRAERYHDISCGHRVAGHESKCAFLHGHNYRLTFVCEAPLDSLGRVLDFSAIKEQLCMWAEKEWDHKFLAWDQDPVLGRIDEIFSAAFDPGNYIRESIVWVPFNPTAENMAQYLLEVIGPQQLKDTGVRLVKVVVEETRKCSATATSR